MVAMISDMQLIWNASIREKWDGFESRQARLLEQSWAYGAAMQAQGLGVQRVEILHEGECVGQAQFITRRVLGYIGLASCSRGPVWSPLASPPLRAQGLRLLKRQLPLRPWRAVLFSPSATDPQRHAQDTGRLHQVITGDATSIVDLQQSEQELHAALHGKWRNRLRRAQQPSGLSLFVGTDASRLQALLSREAEQRREKRFYGLPLAFVESFVASHALAQEAYTLCEISAGQNVLAGLLFLRHGRTATYHIGWLSPQARSMNLHNLLMWQGLLKLREQGLHWLDLGGINTAELAGISHFKLGVGGQTVVHPGTFF